MDEKFQEEPCNIVKQVGSMIKKCEESQGLESPICKFVLHHLHESLVEDYMSGDEEKWCESGYFMKNVTTEFKSNTCHLMNNLRVQLKSCDLEDDLCSALNETMSDVEDLLGHDVDICREKKFLFYVIERIIVMKSPCEIQKMISNMNTDLMSKRSDLAKLIFNIVDSIVTDDGFSEMVEELFGTTNFWSVDLCKETSALESFLYDDMKDVCKTFTTLGSYNESCSKDSFLQKNRLACTLTKAVSSSGVPEFFKELTDYELFNLQPCEEGQRAMDHIKSVAENPCTILESLKDIKDCSDGSLYCKIMNEVLAFLAGDDEDGLEAMLSENMGVSLTDINPCEMAEFIHELWKEIGETPCSMFSMIEEKGSCKSKSAPCTIFKKVVEWLTNSEIATGFKDTFGFKLWQMNPCEEWAQVKRFLLSLLETCSFTEAKSTLEKQCGEENQTAACVLLKFAFSSIDADSSILLQNNWCEERDYASEKFVQISKAAASECMGYSKLSNMVRDCKNLLICEPLNYIILDCFGRADTDSTAPEEEGPGVCEILLEIRQGAANIDKNLEDVCQLIPEVKCNTINTVYKLTSKAYLGLGKVLTLNVTLFALLSFW